MSLILEDISFRYPNQKEDTIKDLSLTLDLSKHTAIMGASGSGKSTILRLIAGFEEAREGTIILKNQTLYNKYFNVQPEKRNIGIVLQNYILFPHITVEENIHFAINNIKNHSKEEKKTRLEETLKLIEMEDHRHAYPHMLSGGQQQRVALGRALSRKPEVLLLDEPFSNLDAFLRNKIKKELKDILDRAKISAILVTHHVADLDIAQHIVLMDKGGKAKEGTLSSLREDTDCPVVKHLLSELS
ncbi:MAG: ABC transporter ATP-binding protein [Brevinema sp.]